MLTREVRPGQGGDWTVPLICVVFMALYCGFLWMAEGWADERRALEDELAETRRVQSDVARGSAVISDRLKACRERLRVGTDRSPR